MTDLEQFVKMMRDFGIEPEIEGKGNGETGVELLAEVTPKVAGYTRFFATFIFNPDGSFKEAGVWE